MMKQTDRIKNAEEFRNKYYSPKRKVWEMFIEYLERYGSISVDEARIAYGEKALSTTAWYCRRKGFYIKTKKNPSNLKSYATYVLASEEERIADESKPQYTHATHGRLWGVWNGMRERCASPKNHNYMRYGGRGIKVCDEWAADFQAFAEWAYANGYDEDASYGECTIDRIDVNGDYEPSNCRWATIKEQQNNRRTNVSITYNNETHTIAEWSKVTGIAPDRIRRRLLSGWSIEAALTTPSWENCTHLTFNGVSKKLSEWGKEYHIPADTIGRRLKRGWSVEDAITKPVKRQKNNRNVFAE